MDIQKKTIVSYQDDIAKKTYSVREGIDECLNGIQDKNDETNAFLYVAQESARKRADELDAIPEEKRGILHGVPMAIKDNLLVEGMQATAASKMLEKYTAAYNATVIQKIQDAGAVIVGKTNLDEFAMGSSTENSAYGTTKNPHDTTKVPGGSSGGSAAAVAASMALGALGSDTGGSIRQPAALCGIVGMKPTYGAVSRYGAIALASSLDQIGPFSKTVADAAKIFNVIKGVDKHDATSRAVADAIGAYRKEDIQGLTIGIPKEYFIDGLSNEVADELKIARDIFEKAGAKVKEVSLPHTQYALSCYYIIMPAEASSNLARFDGLRYASHTGDEISDLLTRYLKERGEGFGEETKRRILLGTFVLSSGYYDAYYTKAQKVRRLISDDFTTAFNDVDVLFTPTTPTTAFRIGEKKDDPLAMYLSDIFTIPVNLAGLPALSIPVRPWHEYNKEKMPVGFQLIGKQGDDNVLFSIGQWYEQQ